MYLKVFVFSVMIKLAMAREIIELDKAIDGVLINREFIKKFQKAVELKVLCPEKAIGNVCANDCQTLMACTPTKSEPLFSINCAVNSPSLPYCIPGDTGCTKTGNQNNAQCIAAQTSTFKCTSIGYFPDPSECDLFHICTREVHETYQCPSHYVFDATLIKCTLKLSLKDSCKVDCSNSPHQYIPYRPHKGYWVHCGHNEAIMFKCGDIKNFQYNPKTLDCDFVCKSEGWFPNYKNCRQYYECYKPKAEMHSVNSRGWKWLRSRIQTCPPNFIFNAKQRRCVEGQCTIATSEPPLATSTIGTSTDTEVTESTPTGVTTEPELTMSSTTDTINTETTTTPTITTIATPTETEVTESTPTGVTIEPEVAMSSTTDNINTETTTTPTTTTTPETTGLPPLQFY